MALSGTYEIDLQLDDYKGKKTDKAKAIVISFKGQLEAIRKQATNEDYVIVLSISGTARFKSKFYPPDIVFPPLVKEIKNTEEVSTLVLKCLPLNLVKHFLPILPQLTHISSLHIRDIQGKYELTGVDNAISLLNKTCSSNEIEIFFDASHAQLATYIKERLRNKKYGVKVDEPMAEEVKPLAPPPLNPVPPALLLPPIVPALPQLQMPFQQSYGNPSPALDSVPLSPAFALSQPVASQVVQPEVYDSLPALSPLPATMNQQQQMQAAPDPLSYPLHSHSHSHLQAAPSPAPVSALPQEMVHESKEDLYLGIIRNQQTTISSMTEVIKRLQDENASLRSQLAAKKRDRGTDVTCENEVSKRSRHFTSPIGSGLQAGSLSYANYGASAASPAPQQQEFDLPADAMAAHLNQAPSPF